MFVFVSVFVCLFVGTKVFRSGVFDIATPCFASSNPRVLHKSACFVLSLSVSGNLKIYLLVGLIFNEAHVQLRIIIIRHSILKIYMVLI